MPWELKAMLLWAAVIVLWIAVGIAVTAPLNSRIEKVAAYLTLGGALLLILYIIVGG